jgi:predicted metal-binding protein
VTPEAVISLLAVSLLATGWALWLLPVGSCNQCPHCQLEKLAKERETEARVSRAYGIQVCQSCGGYHARGEAHRR